MLLLPEDRQIGTFTPVRVWGGQFQNGETHGGETPQAAMKKISGNPQSSTVKIDVLTSTAAHLQDMLQAGVVTSAHLVSLYLQQIEKHNEDGLHLRAIISTAPRDLVLERARRLDIERRDRKDRGPMHGIPIIVKDNILTPSLGMNTTCGSYALKGVAATRDATIIERLQTAGMLIIAKTTLSEWSNMKQALMTAGWSALGGQTQSPYVRGCVRKDAMFLGHSTPCGSSSGSGAGVAAGFAPVSIGTESDGSLVQPATRAGLYSLKATIGAVDMSGSQASASWVASCGPMAKSVKDLANLMTILMDSHQDFSMNVQQSWKGLRIGFVDPDLWQPAPFVVEPNEDFKAQTYREMKAAVSKISNEGAYVEQPVPLVTLAEVTKNSGVNEIEDIMRSQQRAGLKRFLSLYNNSPIKTIDDIIEYNKDHADLELPPEHAGQESLERAAGENISEEQFVRSSAIVRNAAAEAIEKSLRDHNVDVIMGPADARMASVAAAAGFPVGTVPLGYANFNGRAFGMNIIAAAGQESKMIEVMSAWENTFPEARKPPPILSNWDSTENEANT